MRNDNTPADMRTYPIPATEHDFAALVLRENLMAEGFEFVDFREVK